MQLPPEKEARLSPGPEPRRREREIEEWMLVLGGVVAVLACTPLVLLIGDPVSSASVSVQVSDEELSCLRERLESHLEPEMGSSDDGPWSFRPLAGSGVTQLHATHPRRSDAFCVHASRMGNDPVDLSEAPAQRALRTLGPILRSCAWPKTIHPFCPE